MQLDERKQKILAAIVDVYIRTGEPVGSKTLAAALDNAVSSATIRNEMAELALGGYLEQPHTSAGRVPTVAAYRLYIDRLMRRNRLSREERRVLDDRLQKAAEDPDRLMERAADALADLTGLMAVSVPPSGGARVRRIDLFPVSAHTATVLLFTDGGQLYNRRFRMEWGVDATRLERLHRALTARFEGVRLADIGLPQVQGLLPELGEDGLALLPALTAFHELATAADATEVRLSGHLNLLHCPDYAPERTRDLFAFLAQGRPLADLLAAHPSGLQVMLGGEGVCAPLDGSSLIVASCTGAGGKDGSLGLLGPVRMDYAAAIPRLEYFAAQVGRLLADLT